MKDTGKIGDNNDVPGGRIRWRGGKSAVYNEK